MSRISSMEGFLRKLSAALPPRLARSCDFERAIVIANIFLGFND